MTTEEKAKAYDEAMNKIKPLYGQAKRDGNPIWSTYEYLIPELRESEDERMMKNIRLAILSVEDVFWRTHGLTAKEAISYIEKQKQQKPADKEQDSIAFLEQHGYTIVPPHAPVSIVPSSEARFTKWSEEDDATIKSAVHWLEKYLSTIRAIDVSPGGKDGILTVKATIANLKSLRLQQEDNKCISPEEGDIVVNKYGEISVFESWGHHPDGGSFNDRSYFFAKCTLDGDCYDDYDCHPDSEGLRYATPEEIRKIVPYLLKEKM